MTMIEIGLDNRDEPKDMNKVTEYIKLYGLEALRVGINLYLLIVPPFGLIL